MHGIHLTIAIEILAIVAVLFVLTKLKKEGAGKLLTWAGYLALLVGILIMLCSISMGIWGMTSCKKEVRHEMRFMHHDCGSDCMGDDGCMMGMHGKMGKDMCKMHGKDCSGACMGMKGKGKKGCGMMGKKTVEVEVNVDEENPDSVATNE